MEGDRTTYKWNVPVCHKLHQTNPSTKCSMYLKRFCFEMHSQSDKWNHTVYFVIPSAPLAPKNIQTQHRVMNDADFYSITVTWDKPEFSPDTYSVVLRPTHSSHHAYAAKNISGVCSKPRISDVDYVIIMCNSNVGGWFDSCISVPFPHLFILESTLTDIWVRQHNGFIVWRRSNSRIKDRHRNLRIRRDQPKRFDIHS